jgi:hypothetical protein
VEPEAQAAYYNSCYWERDEWGRSILYPAGVEPAPYEAYRLGLTKCQNARFFVYMLWEPTGETPLLLTLGPKVF